MKVYERKFLGVESWAYVVKTEQGYDVYESYESGFDDFLESFSSLSEAMEYADNLT